MIRGKFSLEPARIYAVISALLTLLVTVGFTDLPVVAILGLVSAILGGGEITRSKVTPTVRAEENASLAFIRGVGVALRTR